MNEERPYLQIPLPKPSEQDYRLYEEWLKRRKQEENEMGDDRSVIIIDI